MRDRTLLGPWVRRFLLEHVVGERNLARNSQASCRDTLRLLLPFLSTAIHTPVDRLAVEDLDPAVVRRFLAHLEQGRGCGGATRHLRLGALRSLAKFIGSRSPEQLAWAIELRAIPFKKTATPTLAYLEKPELDAVLQAPNRQTVQGARDLALLLFLYNTGARADEAAHLTIGDIMWGSAPAVRLLGKGNKTRSCPLWSRTVALLQRLAGGRAAPEPVFRNRWGQPLTRFGIYQLVRRAVRTASQQVPALGQKRISPHTLRRLCGPSAPGRGRHQYDPRLAGPRLPGHDAGLHRGRLGDEGQSPRGLRGAARGQRETLAEGAQPHGVLARAIAALPLQELMLRIEEASIGLSSDDATGTT